MPISVSLSPLLRRRTKIVATLGPASSSADIIARLIDAGVDVFRMNMSHGDHAGHTTVFSTIRDVAANKDKPVAVLADLCGPKIRAGRFAGGSVELPTGATVVVTTREVEGTAELIPSQYEHLASDVQSGNRILLDDGNLELRVERVAGTEITCTVTVGGTLKDRKGMNLPGVQRVRSVIDGEGPRGRALRGGAGRRLHRAFVRPSPGGRARIAGAVAGSRIDGRHGSEDRKA
jgi:pyruvate kinase